MKIEKLSEAANSYNEDGLLIYKNVYMVLDGATPLYQAQKTNNKSIASEYVAFIIQSFKEHFDKENDFHKSITQANIDAIKVFYSKGMSKAELPSAGMAAAVFDKDDIQLYVTGDCEIRYQTHKNVYPMIDSRLKKLDHESMNKIYGDSEKTTKEILINARNKIGESDGYDVLLPMENYSLNIKNRKIKRNTTKAILLYTDGLFSITKRNTFKEVNVNKLFNYPLKELYRMIKEKADSDPEKKKYKRFKYIDDVTAIKIILDNE